MQRTYRLLRRGIAAIAALALAAALFIIGGVAQSAAAAEGDVRFTLLENGVEFDDGTPVLSPDTDYTLRMQYPKMDDGQKVSFSVSGIAIDESSLTVPPGNTAIESIEAKGNGEYEITFADPFPGDINQGVFDLHFRVNAVEETKVTQISWKIGPNEETVEVIVKRDGDEKENISTWSNKSDPWVEALPEGAVTVADGTVVVDEALLDAEFHYTLTYSNADEPRQGVEFADALDDETLGGWGEYVADSFSAKVTTWDEQGYNKTVTTIADPAVAIDGSSFTHTADVGAPSIYQLQYTVKIRADKLPEIQQALQAEYDAMIEAGETGDFGLALPNLAVIAGQENESSYWIGSTVRGPEKPGIGLSKAVDINRAVVSTDDEGNLTPPLPIEYTIVANLESFDPEKGETHTLIGNAILRDTKAPQTSWLHGEDGFLTSGDGETVYTAAPDGTTVEQFGGDAFVGQYLIADSGELLVNLGKDPARTTLKVQAQIDGIEGLEAAADDEGNLRYHVGNTVEVQAQTATDSYEQRASTNTELIVYQDEDGVTDSLVFDKRSGVGEVELAPGDTAEIPYTFVVNEEGAVEPVSVEHVEIVDHVDANVFDLSDEALAAVEDSVVAAYGGVALADDEWTLTLDGSDLTFAVTDAFRERHEEAGFEQRLEVTLTLTTKPIEGKQDLEITNAATLKGTDEDIEFVSTEVVDASTYGDELSVRKTVFDEQTDEFTSNLRIDYEEVDGEFVLEHDEYVYRVEIIPHGDFGGVTIIPIQDVLEENLEFVGFVDGVEVSEASTEPYQLAKGNLTASYDAEQHTVTIENPEGSTITNESGIEVFFKVKIGDFDPNVSIPNVIPGTSTIITPTGDHPLMIQKVDASDPTKVIDDENAVFVLKDESGEVIANNVRVKDGLLVNDDGTALRVQEPGAYTIIEARAPEGYQKTDETFEVVVGEHGQTGDVVIPNVPGTSEPEKSYAIGDYTWIDENRDGIQDPDEPVLPGVRVTITDPEGNPVVDIDGNTVEPTETDEHGLYVFDRLPAGDYRITFELTEEQQERYEFTVQDAGDSDAADSDADPATGRTITITLDDSNAALTKDYDNASDIVIEASEGIDPTWDAGVIEKDTTPPTTPEPTPEPTEEPTPTPTPTPEPSEEPTPGPSEEPTPGPSDSPSPSGPSAPGQDGSSDTPDGLAQSGAEGLAQLIVAGLVLAAAGATITMIAKRRDARL
ncbi:SdrD B-like domain-containing protein [Gulosibacter sp. 10]|uniref:SdrD B-like domain-containing protein n=1 Tax=Gulosibacter sp. 10 TaxID=1255570 RepID=UPI001120E35E|nr:SdrD B-like domain-containing protein [Gulosibacter sp. 10]